MPEIVTKEALFRSANWYLALKPTERVSGGGSNERVRRWRAQFPFGKNSVFAQRLAADSMTESAFEALVTQSAQEVRQATGVHPSWLFDLSRAYARSSPWKMAHRVLSEGGSRPGAGFWTIAEPLLEQGIQRLHLGLRRILQGADTLPFDPHTVDHLLLPDLLRRLHWMVGRTLVLELHVARITGLLEGTDGGDRFERFVQLLEERDAATILLFEYPVLARQLALCVDQWVTYSLELLTHLCNDFKVVCDSFAQGQHPGLLTGVQSGAGDRHRNGRSVTLLSFSEGLRLVYKPRSLAVDRHFNQLLGWFNDRGWEPQFQSMSICDRGSYGWTAFVGSRECETRDELCRFYTRQGGYLALLYVLNATDLHHENLIAAGEHPMLLDLESLFNRNLRAADRNREDWFAENAISTSVLQAGLLPLGGGGMPDFSGLGSVEGQLSPVGVPQWEASGTDAMRYVREPMALRGSKNRPTLGGARIYLSDHVDHIVEGFQHMYRLVMGHAGEFLAEGGPLAAFAWDEVRVILRMTQTYGHLLEESFHPDVLRDAVDRDQLFDRLWVAVERSPELARAIPAEQRALQQGDIPRFASRADTCDVWTDSGDRIPNLLAGTGLQGVEERMAALSEHDLQRQTWIIRASIAMQGTESRERPPVARSVVLPTTPTQGQLIQAARTLGDRLDVLAVQCAEQASWIGVNSANMDDLAFSPLGLDLYEGVPGIALFLAHLGAITLEKRYTDLARAALANIQSDAIPGSHPGGTIGGYAGWGGVIYALGQVGRLWNDDSLLSQAEDIVGCLPDLIAQDEEFDLMAGSAGCILSLLCLHRITGSEKALAVAALCGDRLVTRAIGMARGAAWPNLRLGAHPLAGFSHGAAGIAYALLELWALTRDRRYETTAHAALEYERSLFDATKGDWRDLRDLQILRDTSVEKNEHAQGFSAWCHGAPGIGLSRVNMLRHMDNPILREEIDVALRTTMAKGLVDNHSLCHGNLGNIEVVQQASRALGRPDLQTHADHIVAGVLSSGSLGEWRCGAIVGVEEPGLMTGLAGIGYGLLRAAEPSRVPSVLTLAP
jgi:type 2 lantibiotic biosynthesis protein LanM